MNIVKRHKKVKITIITGDKFQDFDNWPLNTVLLNTGLTVIGILKKYLHGFED